MPIAAVSSAPVVIDRPDLPHVEAALVDRIDYVFSKRSSPQMRWIDARGIVAAVKRHYFGRHRLASVQFNGYLACVTSFLFLAIPNVSVSSPAPRPGP